MPTSYTVGDETYASRTAFAKAWRDKMPKSSMKRTDRVYLADALRQWYIRAAHCTHRRSELGMDSALDSALRWRVFVARGDHRDQRATVRPMVFFERPDGHCRSAGCQPERKAAKTMNHKLRLAKWMREQIKDQMQTYRDCSRLVVSAEFTGSDSVWLKCGRCGRSIKGESHVDHGVGEDSFRQIASDFVASVGATATDEAMFQKVQSMRKEWKAFHLARFKPQLTCARCNLVQG